MKTSKRTPSYAESLVRILAFAIDYLFIATYLLALVLGLFLRRIFSDFLPTIFSDPLLGEIAGLVVLTLPVTLFFSLFESSLWQAIFGKNGIG